MLAVEPYHTSNDYRSTALICSQFTARVRFEVTLVVFSAGLGVVEAPPRPLADHASGLPIMPGELFADLVGLLTTQRFVERVSDFKVEAAAPTVAGGFFRRRRDVRCTRARVCALKLHPLWEFLAPLMKEVFAPLIEAGYLAITCGGAQTGAQVVQRPLVDGIHVTGSTSTYRAISATTSKPITAELGNVTPAIVLGGRWTQHEIECAAEAIVSAKMHNNGYNCIALQVLVLPAQWEQRSALLAAIDCVMQRVPRRPRPAYYPGSLQRFLALTADRPRLRSFGIADERYIPPAIVEVTPDERGDPLFVEVRCWRSPRSMAIQNRICAAPCASATKC